MLHRKYFVIDLFSQAISDFGRVIEKINARYGTSFYLFEHNEDNLRRVFEIVEQMDREDTGYPHAQERTVARPSEDREKLKRSTAQSFESPKAKKLLAAAERVYEEFVALALWSENET